MKKTILAIYLVLFIITQVKCPPDLIAIDVKQILSQYNRSTKEYYFPINTDNVSYVVIELDVIFNESQVNGFSDPNWIMLTFSIVDHNNDINDWRNADFKDMECLYNHKTRCSITFNVEGSKYANTGNKNGHILVANIINYYHSGEPVNIDYTLLAKPMASGQSNYCAFDCTSNLNGDCVNNICFCKSNYVGNDCTSEATLMVAGQNTTDSFIKTNLFVKYYKTYNSDLDTSNFDNFYQVFNYTSLGSTTNIPYFLYYDGQGVNTTIPNLWYYDSGWQLDLSNQTFSTMVYNSSQTTDDYRVTAVMSNYINIIDMFQIRVSNHWVPYINTAIIPATDIPTTTDSDSNDSTKTIIIAVCCSVGGIILIISITVCVVICMKKKQASPQQN